MGPGGAARAAFRRTVPTLREYGDQWLENRRTRGRELRPTTRQQYRMLLDKFVYPTFGDVPIDRISADDVNKWYDGLAPGRETIRAQAYSPLRTIFTTAASERPEPLIPYNPAHIRGAGSVKRVHKVRPASLDELETIVNELSPRYKLMALLAAWCAMRFGELAELRRGDIDLRTNRVSITRGVVRVDGGFVVGSPKSDAGVRAVAIPPHLIPVVKAHLKNHTGPGKNALLFPAAADGKSHMAPSTLHRVYYPARKAAGREDLRRPRRPDRRHPRRAHGPPRSLHARRCHALPARSCRPRRRDRQATLRDGRTRRTRWGAMVPTRVIAASERSRSRRHLRCERAPLLTIRTRSSTSDDTGTTILLARSQDARR